MYLLRLLQSRTFYYKVYSRKLQHTEQYFFRRVYMLKIQDFVRARISCSVQNLARVFISVKPWRCSSEQNLFRKHMKIYRNSNKEPVLLTPNMLNNHCKAFTSLRTFCACPQGEQNGSVDGESAVLQFWRCRAVLPAHPVQDIPCPSQESQCRMGPGWRTALEHVLLNYP